LFKRKQPTPILVREYKLPFYKKWKFWAYLSLVVAILLVLFYFKIIILGNITERSELTIINIFFTVDSPEGAFLYSICNGLLLGAYLGIILNVNHSPKALQVFLIVIVLVFAFLGIALGIGVDFYLPTFNPQRFLSNSVEGINFFIGNLPVLSLIFMASLIAESEVKQG